MIVEFQKRSEHINPPIAEQEMTNLLVRLSRTNEKAVMYLDGHGERSLIGIKTTISANSVNSLNPKALNLLILI